MFLLVQLDEYSCAFFLFSAVLEIMLAQCPFLFLCFFLVLVLDFYKEVFWSGGQSCSLLLSLFEVVLHPECVCVWGCDFNGGEWVVCLLWDSPRRESFAAHHLRLVTRRRGPY